MSFLFMFGQVLGITVLSFALLCLLASFFRYERKRDEQAPERSHLPGTREAFLMAIQGEISNRRREGFLVVVAKRKAAGTALFPEGWEDPGAVLRKALRPSDQVFVYEGQAGLILHSPQVDPILLFDRLLGELSRSLPEGFSADMESVHLGAASYPRDGRRAEELLAAAEAGRPLESPAPSADAWELPSPGKTMELAEQVFSRWRREGHPVAVLCAQVDYASRYAEQYGEGALSAMVQKWGHFFRQNLRASAWVGGLEDGRFLLLFQSCAEDALCVAQRLASSVRRVEIPCSDAVLKGTLSVGVAVAPEHGNHWKTLLESAEAALRKAGTKGRGTCHLVEQAQAPHGAGSGFSAGEY